MRCSLRVKITIADLKFNDWYNIYENKGDFAKTQKFRECNNRIIVYKNQMAKIKLQHGSEELATIASSHDQIQCRRK